MTPLHRKMMKVLRSHIDELDRRITELDDELDRNMKDDEKRACSAIQDIIGVTEASSRDIISIIGTDMSRFPTDAHISF